jgi:hypothetical protein
MGGLLSPFGHPLFGHYLAQPGIVVINEFLPLSWISACFVQQPGRGLVVAGQLRMALPRLLRIWQVPYDGARPLPIFGR